MVAVVTEDGRLLVTYHDSFGHFARRYGFEVAGVVTEAVADDLLQTLQGEGIPAVFAEYGFDEAAIEEIAEEAGQLVAAFDEDGRLEARGRLWFGGWLGEREGSEEPALLHRLDGLASVRELVDDGFGEIAQRAGWRDRLDCRGEL